MVIVAVDDNIHHGLINKDHNTHFEDWQIDFVHGIIEPFIEAQIVSWVTSSASAI